MTRYVIASASVLENSIFHTNSDKWEIFFFADLNIYPLLVILCAYEDLEEYSLKESIRTTTKHIIRRIF